ncbi:G-protein alpha subunit-domain-containing protein [Gorgonomyces haynaldii]|nr:G-protein alpha subunit-domain-containing protein [Gorgonomyces haynaldii]
MSSEPNLLRYDRQTIEIYHENLKDYPSVREQLDRESPKTRRQKQKRSKEIDAWLKAEGKKLDPQNHLILLLLGPSDSGKSTVLKQMTLLHGKGFTKEMKRESAGEIQRFIMQATRKIVGYLLQQDPLWDSSELETTVREFMDSEDNTLTEARGYIEKMLQSTLFKSALEKMDDIGVEQCASYFILKYAEIMQQDFLPTDNDMLQMRKKTEHISETVFEIDDKFWHIVDVAGQKSKRSRWTSYMERKATGVLYVFACSAYNQYLEEQPDTLRIVDAIQLYTSLVSDKLLNLNSIIVLFNKFDQLDEKIAKYPISKYLKNYTGFWSQSRQARQESVCRLVAGYIHQYCQRKQCCGVHAQIYSNRQQTDEEYLGRSQRHTSQSSIQGCGSHVTIK